MPLSEVFYDDLDTVRFGRLVQAGDRAARAASAAGALMLGLVIGNAAPLLSQSQAFDSWALLGLIDPRQEGLAARDRLAFLRLALDGFVRVGVLEPAGPAAGASSEPTLLNAFSSALRRPVFEFSAWPELHDQAFRAEVSALVQSAPGTLDTLGSPDLAARFEGLTELDRSLRQGFGSGRPSMKIVPRNAVSSLDRDVRDGLAREEPASPLRALADWVTGRAEALRQGTDPKAGDLDSRSTWYALADDCDLPDRPAETVTALRNLVDGSYNAIVARSLGSAGLSVLCDDEQAARLLAEQWGVRDGYGQRTLDLVRQSGQDDWLRWSQVPDLLDVLGATSPDDRLRSLDSMHRAWVGEFRADNAFCVSVRIAIPAAIGAAVTAAGSLVPSANPVITTAVSGAIAGVVTLIAATPGARHAAERRRERIHRGEGQRHQSSVRSGSAAWPELLAPK